MHDSECRNINNLIQIHFRQHYFPILTIISVNVKYNNIEICMFITRQGQTEIYYLFKERKH